MQIIGEDNLVIIKYDFFKQDDEYTIAEKERWLFGQLCFIIDSICVGNSSEWTSFATVKNYLPIFVENYENRFVQNWGERGTESNFKVISLHQIKIRSVMFT